MCIKVKCVLFPNIIYNLNILNCNILKVKKQIRHKSNEIEYNEKYNKEYNEKYNEEYNGEYNEEYNEEYNKNFNKKLIRSNTI